MSDRESENGGVDDFDEFMERVDELLTRAREDIDGIEGAESTQDALETVDDLQDVVDEAEDLLSMVDFEELFEAVDVTSLPEAVDTENLPEALAEGNPEDAVKLRKLLDLTDLPALLDSVNVREFWREKRELDGEVDDVTDGEEADRDDGYVSVDIADDEERDEEWVDDWGVDMPDIPDEGYETAIQSKLTDATDEFREGLLKVQERLAKMREANERHMEQMRDDRTSSRNPTAVSTISGNRGDMGPAGRHSTVPRETRHSTAPNRERIYGTRFERKREEDEE